MGCLTGFVIANSKGDSGWYVYSICFVMQLFGGFSGGALWVSQGMYISECSNDLNRSLFFGFCNAVSNSSQMIGSVLSAFLI